MEIKQVAEIFSQFATEVHQDHTENSFYDGTLCCVLKVCGPTMPVTEPRQVMRVVTPNESLWKPPIQDPTYASEMTHYNARPFTWIQRHQVVPTMLS